MGGGHGEGIPLQAYQANLERGELMLEVVELMFEVGGLMFGVVESMLGVVEVLEFVLGVELLLGVDELPKRKRFAELVKQMQHVVELFDGLPGQERPVEFANLVEKAWYRL